MLSHGQTVLTVYNEVGTIASKGIIAGLMTYMVRLYNGNIEAYYEEELISNLERRV